MEEFKDCFSNVSKVTIGDKDYNVGEASIGELIEFQTWVKEQVKVETKKLYEDMGQRPDVLKMRELLADPQVIFEKSSSVEGVLYLIQLMMKRLNKDFDPKHFIDNITTEKLGEIDTIINKSNEEDEKEPTDFPQEKEEKKEDKWL
jgi:hypothetical protein